MTEANKILEMIETVSPDDTAKLNEIDAAVQALVMGITVHELYCRSDYAPIWYTRSRDALKMIRPDGWYFDIRNEHKRASCAALGGELMGVQVLGDHLPTEELAELHAIIQAIEWERSQ